MSKGDKLYPKHIWLADGDGSYWHGMLVNAEQGAYKGWPINRKKYDAISSA